MRRFFAFASIIALCGGCSQPFGNGLSDNGASGSGSGGTADASVSVAATGDNPCAASWNGQPVTNAELTNRTFALMEQAIERVGGVANIQPDSLPAVRLEATSSLTFACVGPVVDAIQRGGIAEIKVRPADSASQPVSVYASLPGMPPASETLEIGPGRRIAWNGEVVDLPAVRARAQPLSGSGAPPGMMAVIVAGDVSVADAFGLLEAVGGVRPMLLPPGSIRPPAEPAAPPPPPDPLAGRR